MAVKGEIKFKDAEGNDLEGPRPNGSCTVLEFSQRLRLPYTEGTGQVTGSRIYDPFTILKEIDKLTPFMSSTAHKGRYLNLLRFRFTK